jgi:hypothetical protein
LLVPFISSVMHKLKPLYQSDATLEQVKAERAMGGLPALLCAKIYQR